MIGPDVRAILNRTVATAVLPIVLFAGCTASDDAGSGHPTPTSAEATPTTSEQTLNWFRGQGTQALTMHQAARTLLGGPIEESRCRAVIESLEHGESPATVMALIANVPDTEIQAALVEERNLLTDVIRACIERREPGGQAVRSLREVTNEIDTRLEELGYSG